MAGTMRRFHPPKLLKLKRVLVIDDDPICLALTQLALEDSGLEVQSCPSGEAACSGSLADGWVPDLILSDLHLPGLSGATLAELLAERWPRACRVAMTASTTGSKVGGYIGFLQKPLAADELSQKLARLYRDSQSENGPQGNGPQEEISTGKLIKNAQPPMIRETRFEQLQRSMPRPAFTEFLRLVLKDTGERIDEIERAFAARDMEQVRYEAHRLRGSSGMIGAALIEETASVLEVDPKSQHSFKKNLAKLKHEHRRLDSFLSQYLP